MNQRLGILLALIAVSLSLASCSERGQMPGKSFEGKIVEKIGIDPSALMRSNGDSSSSPSTMSSLNSAMTVTMYTKGDKVAYDFEIIGFPIKAHTIIDRNARTITIMTPDKKAYVADLRSLDSIRTKIDDTIEAHPRFLDSLSAHLPQPTGVKKTINGLPCEEYKAKFGNEDVTVWVTQDPRLKFFDILRDAFLGKYRTGLGGMEELLQLIAPLAGEGHVPVLTEIGKNGNVFARSEMTELSEESVSDDIVTVPSDYTIVHQDLSKPESPKTEPPPAAAPAPSDAKHKVLTRPE